MTSVLLSYFLPTHLGMYVSVSFSSVSVCLFLSLSHYTHTHTHTHTHTQYLEDVKVHTGYTFCVSFIVQYCTHL